MSNQIIVTRGLPGSGKSTWADEYVASADSHVKVERDDLRMQLFNSYWTGKQEDEELVTRLQEELVRGYLKHGMSVIISDTHLPDRSVKKWLKLGYELSVPVEVKDFRSVPLQQCLIQNGNRFNSDKHVAEEVIQGKYNRFIKGRDLSKAVEYTPAPKATIEPYVQPYVGRRAFLVDVDGTLAHKHPDRDIYDGSKAHLDAVNDDVAKLVDTLVDAGYQIIVMTGRGAEHRQVTEDWLAAQGIWYDELYTRAEGDSRPDYIVKHELFQTHVAPKQYSIRGVLDDRNSVVAMWRELGLTCFQVAEGDF